MIEAKSATKRVTVYRDDAIELQMQSIKEDRSVADIIKELRNK